MPLDVNKYQKMTALDPSKYTKLASPQVQMPDAGKMVKSGAGKIWDFATTSLTGMEEPTIEEWSKNPSEAARRAGIVSMTTPLALGGELLGGAGLVAKRLGMFGKAAPEVSAIISPELKRARNIIEAYEGAGALKGKTDFEIKALADKLDPLKYAQGETPLKVNVGAEPEIKLHKGGSAYDDQLIANLHDEIKKTKNLEFVDPDIPPGERLRQFAELSKQEAEAAAKKPKLKANLDGTFTNLETGEVIEAPKPPKKLKFQSKTKAARSTFEEMDGPMADDYSAGVLRTMKEGKPGLSVEHPISPIDDKIDSKIQNIVYRDNKGNPIAGARLRLDTDGTWTVEDLAADKSKGLLYGRGVKSVVTELDKRGINTSNSSLTPDSINLLKKAGVFDKPAPDVRSIANEVNINSGDMPNVKKGRAERIRTTNPDEGRRMLAQMAGNEPPTITPPNDTPFVSVGEIPQEQGSLGFGKGSIPPEPPKNIFRQGAEGAGQVLSEARQAQTSFDLSAPFRQGINAVTREEFWKNLAPMVKSAFSDETFKARELARMAHADYPILEQAGVEFTNLGSNLARREEQLRGKWLEKIPGFGELIKGSNRGYTEFTNSLRFDMGKRMLQDARAVGADADFFIRGARGEQKAAPTLKAIGNYINDATGRGDLGRFEKSAVELNQALFSPKLIASRVNMLNRALDATVGSIGGRTGIIKAGVNPAVAKQLRMEALRSMAGVGGLAVGSIGISKLMDSKGSEDPRSTDFGKIKVGDTRLDFTGGYQQYVRLAAQLATHQVNREGRISDANRADTAGRFAWAKLSPMASLIVDNWKGKNVVGDKFEWTPELRDRIVPLIAQDLYEISQSDPSLFGAAAGTAAFFGAGSQSYEPRTYGRKKKGSLFAAPKIKLPSFKTTSIN